MATITCTATGQEEAGSAQIQEITQYIYLVDTRAVASSLKMKGSHSYLNLKLNAAGFFPFGIF